MTRPDWNTFWTQAAGSYILCSCKQILQTVEAVKEHWQAGHFDYVEPKTLGVSVSERISTEDKMK